MWALTGLLDKFHFMHGDLCCAHTVGPWGVCTALFVGVLQTYASYRIHSQRHRDSIYLENHAPLTTQGIKDQSLELKHGTQFPQG